MWALLLDSDACNTPIYGGFGAALLLQKQRLETERRLHELERDQVEIAKRIDDVRAEDQKAKFHHATLPAIAARHGAIKHMRKVPRAEGTATPPSLLKKSHSLGSDFGAPAYRKLDFYVDKMTSILQKEQTDVTQFQVDRQVRFAQVQHTEGLEQFWRLFHASHKREVVAWLKARVFVDVNVPVRLIDSAQGRVEPNKELGLTPLMAACRCLCVEMVQELLEQGAVVHLATANGDTALHFIWKDWPLVAPGTTTSSLKDVAEMTVKAKNSFRILTALISHDVDVNAQNEFGETALHFCARLGLEDCVKLLLTRHADVHTRDRHGKNAIQYAQEHNRDTLYRILLHYDVIERTKAREDERKKYETLLKQGRGALTANWSQPHTHTFWDYALDIARMNSSLHLLFCTVSSREATG
ncbi:Ankyrin repeat domain-containing protein 1, partial [Globisporangium splendens]